jgi:hypothetical protein
VVWPTPRTERDAVTGPTWHRHHWSLKEGVNSLLRTGRTPGLWFSCLRNRELPRTRASEAAATKRLHSESTEWSRWTLGPSPTSEGRHLRPAQRLQRVDIFDQPLLRGSEVLLGETQNTGDMLLSFCGSCHWGSQWFRSQQGGSKAGPLRWRIPHWRGPELELK